MLRCSYTWEEYDNEKGEYVRNQCSEKVWENSEKYCIFHELSRDKDIGLFKERLRKKLDSKDYDFHGYCFPVDADFSNSEFDRNVYFNGATFQEKVEFNGATFQEKVEFNGATFQDAFFGGAKFQGASFNRTTFGNVSFDEATFQDTTFTGTTFKNSSFEKAAFHEDADFKGAKFQNVSFYGAKFQNVSFYGAKFQNVSFDKARFKKKTYFRKTTFHKDVSFNKTVFKNAFFDETTFHKDVSFNKTIIERNLDFKPRGKQVDELDLRNTQFLLKGRITADLTKAKFYRASLENVAFSDSGWPENHKIYEEVQMQDEGLSFKDLETIYRNLKQNMQLNGNYSRAGEFFYREMEMKRKGAKTWKDRIWFWFYWLLAGYGERPKNTVAVSLLVVSIFAGLYEVFGCLQYSVKNPCLFQQITDALYFSFVTFTTLGLGDIRPVTSLGKMLICCEAVIGAFLIALFVVVFVRKMAR